MASDIQWRDVGVGNLDGRGIAAASNSLSAAGDVFTKLAGQLAARDQAKADLAFRQNAMNQQLGLDREKMAQDQAQFDADMAFKNADATWTRGKDVATFLQAAYGDAQANSTTILPPIGQWAAQNYPGMVAAVDSLTPTGGNPSVGGITAMTFPMREAMLASVAPNTNVDAVQPSLAPSIGAIPEGPTQPIGLGGMSADTAYRASLLGAGLEDPTISNNPTTPTNMTPEQQVQEAQNVRRTSFSNAWSNINNSITQQYLASQGVDAVGRLSKSGNAELKALVKDGQAGMEAQVKQAWARQYMDDITAAKGRMDESNYQLAKAEMKDVFGKDLDIKDTPIQAAYDSWKISDDLAKTNRTAIRNDLKSELTTFGNYVSEADKLAVGRKVDDISSNLTKVLGLGSEGNKDAIKGAVAKAYMEALNSGRDINDNLSGLIETSSWNTDLMDDVNTQLKNILSHKNQDQFISSEYLDDDSPRGAIISSILASLERADLIPKKTLDIKAANDEKYIANQMLASRGQVRSATGSLIPTPTASAWQRSQDRNTRTLQDRNQINAVTGSLL